MIKVHQLNKFFDIQGSWLGSRSKVKVKHGVDLHDLDKTLYNVGGHEYNLREGFEAKINDDYRFEILMVYHNGQQLIFEADEERWIELIEYPECEIKFYKVTREEVR